MSESLTEDSKHNYKKKRKKKKIPYIQYIKICYSPALDSLHISHSKSWGKDVDKVGSYCIFSYTDMFQDPRSKACV